MIPAMVRRELVQKLVRLDLRRLCWDLARNRKLRKLLERGDQAHHHQSMITEARLPGLQSGSPTN